MNDDINIKVDETVKHLREALINMDELIHIAQSSYKDKSIISIDGPGRRSVDQTFLMIKDNISDVIRSLSFVQGKMEPYEYKDRSPKYFDYGDNDELL